MDRPTKPQSNSEASHSTSRFRRLRGTMRLLYYGHSATALNFQRAVLIVDLVIIAFFIAAPLLRDRPSFLIVDLAVAVLLLADLVARGLASTNLMRWMRQPTTLVDWFVFITLLLPGWLANFGFLRVLRLWTLSRNGFLWRPLRARGYAAWEETGRAIVNLVTFLFVVAELHLHLL